MNTRIFTTGALACAVFLAGAAQAAEQAADPYPPVKFDLPEHQAFVDSLKLDPARHQGPQTKEEIKAVLNEAILLTKPFFGKKKNTSDLYSEMEIKLFLGLIQFSEDISWKEAELKRMLLFTRKYDSKKIKEQAEMSILKELASIQEEKGDAQKELEYIEQALTLVKESRTMRGLAELHFKKAGLLKELMQRNKDMQQEYQKQCQVELTMAYYTALVMNNVELVQKIKTTGDRV